MLNVYGNTLQTRHNLKGGKFEGIRDDEAEGLEAELAPLASDSLKYGLAYFCALWHNKCLVCCSKPHVHVLMCNAVQVVPSLYCLMHMMTTAR